MELIDQIFVGAGVENLGTVVYSLKREIPVLHIYCICMEEGPKPSFVILSSRELFSGRYQRKKYKIAGIARGRKEAVEVLCYMYQEGLKEGISPEEIYRIL